MTNQELSSKENLSDIKTKLRKLEKQYPDIAKLPNDRGLTDERYQIWQSIRALKLRISHYEKNK